MAQVKHRLIELISQKQMREGRRISQVDIARESGVHENTIRKWLSGDVTRFDDKVVIPLCRYFECDLSDLLYIDWQAVDLP